MGFDVAGVGHRGREDQAGIENWVFLNDGQRAIEIKLENGRDDRLRSYTQQRFVGQRC